MAIQFEKRFLAPDESARCTVCERIVQSVPEDTQEWQYRKTPKASETKRPGFPTRIPKESDQDDQEFVFIQTDNPKNVLCRYCYHLHKTTVELK